MTSPNILTLHSLLKALGWRETGLLLVSKEFSDSAINGWSCKQTMIEIKCRCAFLSKSLTLFVVTLIISYSWAIRWGSWLSFSCCFRRPQVLYVWVRINSHKMMDVILIFSPNHSSSHPPSNPSFILITHITLHTTIFAIGKFEEFFFKSLLCEDENIHEWTEWTLCTPNKSSSQPPSQLSFSSTTTNTHFHTTTAV